MSPSVERLNASQREEIVAVLNEAFHDYPVMRYVLADAGEHYVEQLTALNDYFCDRRFGDDGAVFGVSVDDELAGVAVLDAPVGPNEPQPDDHRRERVLRLVRAIGSHAVERLRAYDQVGDSLMPPGSYHYLGMLGVLRRCQGQGLGRLLVEATQALAEESTLSTGVCLHTETPGNVPLYERLGFEVVGEDEVAGLRTWCMMWRTD